MLTQATWFFHLRNCSSSFSVFFWSSSIVRCGRMAIRIPEAKGIKDFPSEEWPDFRDQIWCNICVKSGRSTFVQSQKLPDPNHGLSLDPAHRRLGVGHLKGEQISFHKKCITMDNTFWSYSAIRSSSLMSNVFYQHVDHLFEFYILRGPPQTLQQIPQNVLAFRVNVSIRITWTTTERSDFKGLYVLG